MDGNTPHECLDHCLRPDVQRKSDARYGLCNYSAGILIPSRLAESIAADRPLPPDDLSRAGATTLKAPANGLRLTALATAPEHVA